jgi:deoxyribose-phosphate aldolase
MEPNPTDGGTVQEPGQAARPALASYEDLAQMIDHSLLRPELNDEQIAEGCRIAAQYRVASVTARPADVDQVVGWMKGSGVPVGSVVGFPHGSSTTATKIYETNDLLRRGAREIDAVINIGKLISRQFQYVETELLQLAKACHGSGAILKVIFENAYLTDELKVIGCRIARRAGVDFTKTSTGFAPSGATLADLQLMYKHSGGGRVKVKAAGGVRSLDAALDVYKAGASRFGATATVGILEDWKKRLAEAEAQARTS